ncbi:MAG: hypothetical protein WA802_10580 [Terracidiphilus sp.]
MNPARFGLLLLLALPIALDAQPCVPPDLTGPAEQVRSIQSQLLAVKLRDEMDEGVPAALRSRIQAFKDAFAALADTAIQCAPANANPKALGTTLVKLLDANKPEVHEVYDPKKPPQLDHIYGDGLQVKVTAPANVPHLLFIEFNFGIACGFDSVLLGYEANSGAWERILRWQAPAYDSVDAAFGDFFEYQPLPQAGPKSWLIAVAHGHPWCTSNMSAFDVDLLQPATVGAPEKTLFHRKFYYRRDTDPVMKAKPLGFELRMTGESIDGSIVMRPVIYRFQQQGNALIRVQPIAMNGRDFVDEWIQSPWTDASSWSAASELVQLERVHAPFAARNDSHAKEFPSAAFGAVRGCNDAGAHYQVEADLDWTDQNGNSRDGGTVYFQIEEGKNSFTMLSASSQPDQHCKGPDIMPKQ